MPPSPSTVTASRWVCACGGRRGGRLESARPPGRRRRLGRVANHPDLATEPRRPLQGRQAANPTSTSSDAAPSSPITGRRGRFSGSARPGRLQTLRNARHSRPFNSLPHASTPARDRANLHARTGPTPANQHQVPPREHLPAASVAGRLVRHGLDPPQPYRSERPEKCPAKNPSASTAPVPIPSWYQGVIAHDGTPATYRVPPLISRLKEPLVHRTTTPISLKMQHLAVNAKERTRRGTRTGADPAKVVNRHFTAECLAVDVRAPTGPYGARPDGHDRRRSRDGDAPTRLAAGEGPYNFAGSRPFSIILSLRHASQPSASCLSRSPGPSRRRKTLPPPTSSWTLGTCRVVARSS